MASISEWGRSGDSTSLSDPRTTEHIKRANAFNIGWKYFKGEHTRPFKTKPKAKDHNVLENWYGSVISQGVHFLFGSGVIPESDNTAVQDFWAADPLANWSPAQFQKMLGAKWSDCGDCIRSATQEQRRTALP